jgi:hypothetical protein
MTEISNKKGEGDVEANLVPVFLDATFGTHRKSLVDYDPLDLWTEKNYSGVERKM